MRAASISQSLFAYSGEDDFFEGGLVGFADALEFAAGDDVEACSLLGQEAEDGEGGVGFDGVADGVGASGEGLLEELEALGDLRGGVDVERRAVFFGEGGEVWLRRNGGCGCGRRRDEDSRWQVAIFFGKLRCSLLEGRRVLQE